MIDNSKFTINNIGATINGYKNEDGTYTITSKGSKMGAPTKTKIISPQEFEEKYANKINLEKTPKKDTFEKSGTLDTLLKNPILDAMSPEIGGVKFVNSDITDAANLIDSAKWLDGAIKGDEEKKKEAGESIMNTAKTKFPFLPS